MASRKPSVAAALALGAAFAAACDERGSPPTASMATDIATIENATPASAPAALAPDDRTAAAAPRSAPHFASSTAMRHALVADDLPAFRAASAALAEREISARASETWTPYLEPMRNAAKRGRVAKTLEGAARAFADVGRACGRCHEELGGPKLAVGAPPAASGAKARMTRHAWAAARLWEGLMAPSEEAWTKGAEAFADAPLAPDAASGRRSVPPHVLELAKHAHRIGARARAAGDPAARASAVADAYTTCIHCHATLQVFVRHDDERL